MQLDGSNSALRSVVHGGIGLSIKYKYIIQYNSCKYFL